MVIHRPFDEVLRSWSHVAVLRTLLDSAAGLTGNQVARASGMQPRSALKALSSLEVLGIVRRQRGGRDHLFTLNRDHLLVQEGLLPLYAAESKLARALEESLSAALKGKVIAALIFGSVARNDEEPASDLDVCCIVRTENDKETVRESLAALSPTLLLRFGVRLAPLLFSDREARRQLRSPLVKRIVQEGKTIVGTLPRGLRHG